MRECVVSVAEFLFGVEGTCFPTVSAECEVASLDLQGFVDFLRAAARAFQPSRLRRSLGMRMRGGVRNNSEGLVVGVAESMA